MRCLVTILLLFVCFGASAQYDAPGLDPVMHHLQPNAYARVAQAATPYPFTPYRVEYYQSVTGEPGLPVTFVWDVNYGAAHIRGGKMVTPTQALMDVPRMWRKGLTGAGVKIGVIDLGYSASLPHASITVSKAFNSVYEDSIARNTNGHTVQVISEIAARNNDSAHILGTAYDAQIYAYTASIPIEQCIDQALLDGCKIITCELVTANTQDMADAVKRVHDAGGVVIFSGSDDTAWKRQNVCGIPWVVCVGGTVGGGVTQFADSLYPLADAANNKFSLPYLTVAAAYPGDNLYQIVGGTSYTAPQVAALFALLRQKFPKLPGRALYWMLRSHARVITDQGISTYVPDLKFLK